MVLERHELDKFVKELEGPAAIVSLFKLWLSTEKFRGYLTKDPRKKLKLTKAKRFYFVAKEHGFQDYQIKNFLRNRRQIEKDMPAIYRMLAEEVKNKPKGEPDGVKPQI